MYKQEPGMPYTMPTASIFRDPRPWEQGGMRYGKVTSFGVTFLTDRDLAAQLLPEPFQIGDEALISVTESVCEDVDWLAGKRYNLVGADVASIFDGEVDKNVRGSFCVIMWENMVEPIIGGRDHSGVPKVYADIEDITRQDASCLTSVSHFGHRILKMSGSDLKVLNKDQCKALEVSRRDGLWMNYKYFPSLENNGADISYACTYPSSGTCTSAWEGAGDIEFFPSSFKQNPTQYVLINKLAELPVLEVKTSRLVVWEPLMALDRLPKRLR